MKTKVTIIDDTGRRDSCRLISMIDFVKSGGTPPPGVRFRSHILVPIVDRKGRKVSEVVETKLVFKGRHLELCVLRAKRWMRSKRFRRPGGAPRHIALAMAAFSLADPKGFKKALGDAAGA